MLRTICALVACALPLCADQFDSARRVIRDAIAGTSTPSVAVAVARDGKIVWEEAFGWADRERHVPATVHTAYSLASVSKPITATGLMVLKERGKIDLDKPVNDYLGEARVRARAGEAREATVRRVANHSAGLPLHYQFFYEDEPYRPPSMEETIRRYGNLITAPGERYTYSNLGYGILDYVIARASGKDYAEFMQQEVFGALGLRRTSVGIGPGLEKEHAIRYGVDGAAIPFYDFDHRGASAVYASAHDLVRFGMFHLKAHLADQKPILSDAAIDEMQRPTMSMGGGGSSGYGVGWTIGEMRTGQKVVSHSGGMGGVSTLLMLVPSERLAAAVLVNGNTIVVPRIWNEIASAMLPKSSATAPAKPTPPTPVPFKPGPELAGTWMGAVDTYKGEVSLRLTIKEDGDVHAQLGSNLETLLNSPNFRDGYLSGRMSGDIGTEDANRRPYILLLGLKLRGNVLNGGITAQSLPGRRAGNALTYWAELTR
jgi:CubicO group peptidase (beta-lactamase class C family)